MAYTFYQLTSSDGKNEPLAYFRYDGRLADYWTGSEWQPSEIFYDKLHNGDPALDKLDSDPTISKAASDLDTFTVYNLRDIHTPIGTITNHNGALGYTGYGNSFAENVKFRLRSEQVPETDEEVWKSLSNNLSIGEQFIREM
jgi:hypothetical protein